MMPTEMTPDDRNTPRNIMVCDRYVGCLTFPKGPEVTILPCMRDMISGIPIMPGSRRSNSLQSWSASPAVMSTHPAPFTTEKNDDTE